MGKKKSRAKQVSKGEIGNPQRTRLRHWEEGYATIYDNKLIFASSPYEGGTSESVNHLLYIDITDPTASSYNLQHYPNNNNLNDSSRRINTEANNSIGGGGGWVMYKNRWYFMLTYSSAIDNGNYLSNTPTFHGGFNPHLSSYYTGQTRYGSEETYTGNNYRSGSYIRFFGDIPLSEYLERSEKEQRRVKGNARILLMDLPNAFYYLWQFQEERNEFLALRDGEWMRVAKNFWEKDEKNCTEYLYKFL